jgi:hypothetical protein
MVIKSKNIIWVGHLTGMGKMRNASTALLGQIEESR